MGFILGLWNATVKTVFLFGTHTRNLTVEYQFQALEKNLNLAGYPGSNGIRWPLQSSNFQVTREKLLGINLL